MLLILLILVILLYITSKISKDKSFKELIEEVKIDFQKTASNVSDLVVKATTIVFDDSITDAIKKFIMIVEEKNRLAKAKGEAFLSGEEKKHEVISRLSEWISNVTGSVESAIDFVESNQNKIESIINDYVSFSNKMEGKRSLSEAEKIIQEQLNK